MVTHNSEKYLEINLSHIETQQFKPSEIIIVDSGSKCPNYLKELTKNLTIKTKVILNSSNIGFSKGNNIGLKNLDKNTDYVIFLNPDAFLPEDFIANIIYLTNKYKQLNIFTGKLIGYDVNAETSTNLIDSTGIFKNWYGRWYDRGQGKVDLGQYDNEILEYIPAICGALIICKYLLVKKIINNRRQFFDESFFMYKEDIELSLYTISVGEVPKYFFNLKAFHCRGWNNNRKKMSRIARLLSAKNDVIIAFRYSRLSIPFSILKYLGVKFFNL
ncbi:glycosyltransferase family 2 protein [Candidatus Venteria ishoeyi]